MKAIDTLLSLAIPAVVIIHLLVAPYTKVEESFNMQATHDILAYGMPTSGNIYQRLSSRYDHFEFPGAVPRTFAGAVMLAGIGRPLIALTGFQHAQFIVRAILGLVNAAALHFMKNRVAGAYGKETARWYTLLQITQFHVMFYASRTLPNMFAFPLTTVAFALFLPSYPYTELGSYNRFHTVMALLTMATAIFRSELAILMCTSALFMLAVHRINIIRMALYCAAFLAFSLFISVPIDSYFWQKPIWPELAGFYYNAVLGSSSNWGVSPWHYYFTSAIPKILTNPIIYSVLIPFALFNPSLRNSARAMILPAFLFVFIYSVQPHKEARFIFYVSPPFTTAAALGANYIFQRRDKTKLYAFASLTIAAWVSVSFAISSVMLVISSLNYPGGDALAELKTLVASTASPDIQTAAVHTDVLSCMTGVTLFGQHSDWPLEPSPSSEHAVSFTFDKTENETILRDPLFWEKFDYVLAEDPTKPLGSWETVGVVEGYDGIEILKPGQDAQDDVEKGASDRVLGRGAVVKKVKDTVRRYTGGWWVGPRMKPRIFILHKLREEEAKWRVMTA